MKKAGTIAAILISVLVIIYIICTERIDSTPYFETAYFRNSCKQADSLGKTTSTVTDSIYAGFARVSITPQLSSMEDNAIKGSFRAVPLAGYGARKGKPATGVHDSIFIKAVALRSGRKLIVIIGADLLIMPPNITDSVAALLKLRGIRREQLFFSATHSHSSLGSWGPGFVAEQFGGKENKNLERWLVNQIVSAITMSVTDMKPSSVATSSFNAGQFTRNRLIGESGTKNDDFSFIYIAQKGKRRAVIGSFSAHATTLGDENMEISADYPGYWERKIEKSSADLALFCAGSVGSQSPVAEGNGFEKTKFIGEALADSLVNHLQKVVINEKIAFSEASLKMSLPSFNMRITTKTNLASFVSRKLMQAPHDVYLQAFRLGDLIWITAPGDFSGEYALQIKNALAAKGFMANISSFNGSYIGYIIPGRYFYMNEYESKIMGWFGPNMGEYTVDLIGRLVKIVTQKENI